MSENNIGEIRCLSLARKKKDLCFGSNEAKNDPVEIINLTFFEYVSQNYTLLG